MGPLVVTPLPERVSPAVGPRQEQPVHLHNFGHEGQPLLVAVKQEPARCHSNTPISWVTITTDASNTGWGGSLQVRDCPGQMGSPTSHPSIKCPSTTGSLLLPPPPDRGRNLIVENGQHHSSLLCEETGRDSESSAYFRKWSHSRHGPRRIWPTSRQLKFPEPRMSRRISCLMCN